MFPAKTAGVALLVLRVSVAVTLTVDGAPHEALETSFWLLLALLVPALLQVIGFLTPYTSAIACLSDLLAEFGIKVIGLECAADFLKLVRRDAAACLILDMRIPDIPCLDLQRRLAEGGHPPVIFISGDCDIRSTVWAMKAGAIEVLTKPVDRVALIAAVQAAFAQDRRLRHKKAELLKLQQKHARLTPREREVLPLIVGGLLNKQAASLLGISDVTLQIHRGQVMRKMEAESFADLVRMAVKLHIPYWRETSQHSAAIAAHA